MSQPTLSILDDFPPVSPETWREVVEKDLNGAPFEKKLVTHTYEGINIQPVYSSADYDGSSDPSGLPGMPDQTRGSELIGNAICGWDVRQEHLHPDPAANNKPILTDLERGVTSIHLRADVASRQGHDASNAKAAEFVGRDGIMLYRLADYDAALQGVYLDLAGLGLEAGAAFVPAAAAIASLWKRRGIANDKARASFNADPLAVLARDGELPMSLEDALAAMAELAKWTSANYPKATSIRVGTGPLHHAGATAAQDIAFSMATGVCYMRAMIDRGMDINAAAKQLMFAYSVGTNCFLAISKLRAARKLWYRVLEASGADVSAQAHTGMTMQVRTSKRVMTQRDPWVNMLRNTATVFAGGIAGANIIIAEPFDSAQGLPSDFGRRIARNTQIILQEESNLTRVIDPAGGCWFIESLTNELAEKAWAIFQEIEKMGGMAEALTSGWVASQIDSAFDARLKNIATRKDPITGVSEFPNVFEKKVETPKPKLDELASSAKSQLAKAGRVGGKMAIDGSMMEASVEAAGNDATLSSIFAAIFEGSEPATMTPIAPHPYAAPFETLRDASDNYLAMTGQRPKVFLANIGPVAHFTARAGYAKNFFEAGGFEVVSDGSGYQGADRDDAQGAADKAAAAFADSEANIAVICSSDVIYPNYVPVVTKTLKQRGARTVILAGAPGENEQAFREAGVDRFIFIKCDVLGILQELLKEEGVLA